MAVFTSYWILDFIFLVVSLIFFFYLHYYFIARHYWSRRKIPHAENQFCVGTLKGVNVKKNLPTAVDEVYKKYKDKPFIGIWLFIKPVLVIMDLDLIKNILIKDFQHFRDRGFNPNEEKEPLTGNLFSLEGAKWRHARVKLTPTFTSGKMKMMFPTMLDCGKELQAFLEKPAEMSEIVEMKDTVSRFTIDTIASCAFGLDANSFKNPKSEFREQGNKIFRPKGWILFQNMLAFVFPTLDRYVPLTRFDPGASKFFYDMVKDTIEYREKNGVKRRDFMELLIQLKNKGYVEDPDAEDTDKEKSGSKFTISEAAAHAFIFFVAGFETSSAAIIFALYELAKNPDTQKKLQNEIDAIIEKHSGITYDGILEMEYLDHVVDETLRLYPPAGLLIRSCIKDYQIPGTDAIVEKGTTIMIPVASIGRDPNYFSNPDSFQPERFSPEERKKLHPFAHLPFGEGPRNCIGSRFGLMQTKIGLTSILSKFDVHVCEESPIPLVLHPVSLAPAPIDGMMKLRISKRK